MNLLPKNTRFFDHFDQLSAILCQVAQLLSGGLRNGTVGIGEASERIEKLERSADEVTHRALEELLTTFITPFDPEDIQALIGALDDVIDAIEDTAFRIVAYRVDPIPTAALELGGMIDRCCAALGRALSALRNGGSVMEACIEVKSIEDEADALQRKMLVQLFGSTDDTLTIVKLKDIYESLESITDRCDDVANVIQSIAVKNL